MIFGYKVDIWKRNRHRKSYNPSLLNNNIFPAFCVFRQKKYLCDIVYQIFTKITQIYVLGTFLSDTIIFDTFYLTKVSVVSPKCLSLTFAEIFDKNRYTNFKITSSLKISRFIDGFDPTFA